MRHLLRRKRFSILATFLLASLLLLTLPVSYAVWREALGVAADLDIATEPTSTVLFSPTPSVVTATPTITSPATATPLPSLQAAIITIVPNTVVPSSQLNNQAIIPVLPTSFPTFEAPPTTSLPADPPAIEPLPTEPLPTEEPAPAPVEPPAELPTELPAEAPTPSGE